MKHKTEYRLAQTSRFNKDIKTVIKRNYDVQLLDEVVELLRTGTKLPVKYNDHKLTGNWKDYRECHITPDWLLIYKIDMAKPIPILSLTRTGTHSDLL